MKKVLVLGLLFLATISYGQIVYKTDYEKAIERMGTVYSISSQDVGEFNYRNLNRATSKIKCILNSFENADTDERIQEVFIQIGSGLFTRAVNVNTREIEALIIAVSKIKANNKLRYITETANLRIRGCEEKGLEDMIALDLTADGSMPGDFMFVTQGYISPDELIKLLESAKAMAD